MLELASVRYFTSVLELAGHLPYRSFCRSIVSDFEHCDPEHADNW